MSLNDQENLLERKREKKPHLWGYIIVCIFSLGPSYVLGDGLFVEVPIFEITQPEGLAISTVITIARNATLLTVVPLYFVMFKYCNKCINYPILIYSFCILNIVAAIFAALFWDLVMFNISITIIIVGYVSHIYGSLFTAVMLPYLSTINSGFIPAALTGSNIGSLSTAVVGLIQRPGDTNPYFQPNVFFAIWSIVGVIALIFYIYFDKIYAKQFYSHPEINEGDSGNDIRCQLIVQQTPTEATKTMKTEPKYVMIWILNKQYIKI